MIDASHNVYMVGLAWVSYKIFILPGVLIHI